MKKILLIEDDPKIAKFLELQLKLNDYLVDIALNGEDGIKKFEKNTYDIILLDLMMPKVSGEDVCKNIRVFSEIPIIIITAKSSILTKVELLDMGADDYITKPFAIEELLARMRVVLRNKKNIENSDLLSYSNLKINTKQKICYLDDEIINLTKTEYKLLKYFLINYEIVLSREQILLNIWGFDYVGGEKIVDVYVNTLRKKIEINNNKFIQTIRGFGYSLKK